MCEDCFGVVYEKEKKLLDLEGGNILYSCGHVLHDPEAPQDQDWQSEVECPNCTSEFHPASPSKDPA